MTTPQHFPIWSWLAPLVGVLLFVFALLFPGAWLIAPMAIGLFACVQASVHHAEVIAIRVGEPMGTFVLALAVTIIEVALITMLMISGGESATFLARDSVFAAVMIILNGVIGLCLVVGAARHHEQAFQLRGVSAALATLSALAVLTLVLPNHTKSLAGPIYTSLQLVFVGIASLILYVTFVFVQTIRHRDYFLPEESVAHDESVHAAPPSRRVAWGAFGLLFVSLCAVVGLAKLLSPAIEAAVDWAGAPRSLVGIVIALVVLLPEGFAAVRAAKHDRLQTSMNLALGSALATIGLTIPTLACVSILTGLTLSLGLEAKESVLLMLTLIVSTLSLGTGRTTVLQGAVHLVIFAAFLFTTIFP